MSLKLSSRSDISMFRALDILREVNERAVRGEDIMRLGAGQPNVGAPQAALDYAVEVIKADPRQGYTAAMGMEPLRERISEYYCTHYDVSVKSEQRILHEDSGESRSAIYF